MILNTFDICLLAQSLLPTPSWYREAAILTDLDRTIGSISSGMLL